MKKILLLITVLLLLPGVTTASGPKIKQTDLTTLIGKRLFESPLYEWLQNNSYSTATEELQTDGPVLFIKHYQKGYLLMCDINMTLNSISLYSEGGNYKSYRGSLPYNLKFGMNRDSLYRDIDLRLVDVEDNPFILIGTLNNQIIQLLFNSKGLNQVNITTPDTVIRANDLNFVRLVANGKIVSGNCDSGMGKMTWNDGKASYEGAWEYSMPHGKGYFKDQYNNWYRGEFKYGYFWGRGKMNVAGFYQYEGDFLMSRRQGKGVCNFTLPKDESYEGEWKEDAMSGLGKYTTSPNHYYYGNMADDKFNGMGKLVTPDGWMEGIFKDGFPNGFIKQFVKLENMMVEGSWVNGKREGKFKLTNTETKNVTYKLFKDDIEIID